MTNPEKRLSAKQYKLDKKYDEAALIYKELWDNKIENWDKWLGWGVNPDDKQDKFHMFDKAGVKFQLKSGIGDSLESGIKVYIGRCYTFFRAKRHSLCHWDDPTTPVDTTPLINTPNEAHMLIKETLSLVDEYYELKK